METSKPAGNAGITENIKEFLRDHEWRSNVSILATIHLIGPLMASLRAYPDGDPIPAGSAGLHDPDMELREVARAISSIVSDSKRRRARPPVCTKDAVREKLREEYERYLSDFLEMDTRRLLLKSDCCHALETLYGSLNTCLQEMTLSEGEIASLIAEDSILDSICERLTGKPFYTWLEEFPCAYAEAYPSERSERHTCRHTMLLL